MDFIFNIIKADYLQRTRSYSFLITLTVTVFMAYSFVPPDSANYTTLSAMGYKGVNNSAWVGYVSAIMTTIMLSFYGFLLVNSGIKKDIDSEVGLIIATTPITNFKYLLCKQLSNYLVLLTIVAVTFLVSIGVFLYRGSGYPLILSNFIFPYIFFAVPALFVVAALAVAAEVFLSRRSFLQFIAYFFLCGACMGFINSKTGEHSSGVFDPFGLSLITKSITHFINTNYHKNIQGVSFGFIFNGQKNYKPFEWNGLQWSMAFLISRIAWMGSGLGMVYLSSLYFHRFDFKQRLGKIKTHRPEEKQESGTAKLKGLRLDTLPALSYNYGIYPFVKTEFLMLIRHGNKWLWLLNAALWLALCLAPMEIAYSYMLPIILFLQVTRWSELVTKEKTNRVHYFAYASYKPVRRLLPAQILAGVMLAIVLSLPIIIRCALLSNYYEVLSIINGSIFIVMLAVAIGILTGGKKLYEVGFFMITYSVINKLPIADYLGSLPHQDMNFFMAILLAINVLLIAISFIVRNYQTSHL